MRESSKQRGGTILGIIIGLIVGLAAAFAVALYITKTPSNFSNKVQSKNSSNQLEAEKTKNKNWDPNAPLVNKADARNAAANEEPAPTAPTTTAATPDAATSKLEAKKAAPEADTARATAEPAKKNSTAKTPDSKSNESDQIAELIKSKQRTADAASSDAWVYYLQIGAFKNEQDAQTQRAKLSLQGLDAKISEREQSGKIIHRVRSGPYDKKEEAEKIKQKLEAAGFEVGLVRVGRS
jgi:cell division protein FtsN